MNSLLIKKLYIFSIEEKKARIFKFSNGINIVTSCKIDGNKVGKSILMKSIYHTFGADCNFNKKWNTQDKIYIADVLINNYPYQIYRYDRLFKIFKNYELVYVTDARLKLGKYLSTIFNFSIQLPNRSEDKLEITPPAYFYVLNFLDQDKMNGTSFDSFSNLKQYNNYKENLLYSHFGVFNESYYELKKEEDLLKMRQKKLEENKAILLSMIEKIKDDILDIDYSASMDALNQELELHKKTYLEIINNLSKIKEKLINYRNQREDLALDLAELAKSKKAISKDINTIRQHKCPLCKSEVTDNTIMRAKKYNSLEDFILLSNGLELELQKIDRHIEKEKNKYSQQLDTLKKYQEKIGAKQSDTNNILKQQGIIEIRDKFLNELIQIESDLTTINMDLKDKQKSLRDYNDTKKKINQKYYELMLSDKAKFNLKAIDNKTLENIKGNYKAQGSNKGIATTIWNYNLLKLKKQFNPNAIKFPVVLDGPADFNLDDDMEKLFWKYIFDNLCEGTQLIVSTLGFDNKKYKHLPVDKTILIETPKYNLLTEEDYEKNKSILVEFNNAKLNT